GEPDECWPWLAAVNSSGHGRLRLHGRNHLAHKLAYEMCVGPVPDGVRLGHLCDRPGCVNPRHVRPRTSIEMHQARFWRQVDKTSECWIWAGASWGAGYGQMRVNGEARLAHRLSYEWHHGPIPDGMLIDHACWNKSCVNPEHLRVATASENQRNKSGATARSSTGVRGVTLRPNGRYQVRIISDGKPVQVGHFGTLEEAAEAAHAKRVELWGEFAGHE